ncbi:hypothetical protein [Streptomyces sp. NPDC021096]|uniref:hypothetical protein n=1 Tax=Streptomyces sp. NPDC021096 TaxID=3154792 RepID=UPI0033F75CEF
MNQRSRARVRRRLRSLALLELINIPLQAVIWFGELGFPVTVANAAGFALFSLLLLEGSAYWGAKLRQMEIPRAPLPGARAFAAARVLNVPVLFAGVAFTVWAVAGDPGRGTIPGLGFALFAVLEHVNYFHTQLMYDNRADRRRLRQHGLCRSHLSRDLALAGARGGASA